MRSGASSARTSSRARTSHRSRIRPWTATPCVRLTPRTHRYDSHVIGSVAAGHLFEGTVGPGQAVRIMTGAPFPEGADAVCMVENIQDVDSSAVTIMESVAPGQFVRLPGRDVRAGTLLAGAGTALTAAHLGDLANQGVTEVMAHRHPRVGVLSTGDELFAGAGALPPARIRDANRPSLLALVRREGWEGIDLGIARDTDEALTEALNGETGCDAVITTGRRQRGRFGSGSARARTTEWRHHAVDAGGHPPRQALCLWTIGGVGHSGLRPPGEPGVIGRQLRALRSTGAADLGRPHRSAPTGCHRSVAGKSRSVRLTGRSISCAVGFAWTVGEGGRSVLWASKSPISSTLWPRRTR